MAESAERQYRQAEGCEVSQMPDGYVIYQSDREKVHYLNPSAAMVFELCGMGKSVPEIVAFLQSEFALPEPPTADVERCIDELGSAELILPC